LHPRAEWCADACAVSCSRAHDDEYMTVQCPQRVVQCCTMVSHMSPSSHHPAGHPAHPHSTHPR
jgi:hypothetical protein